MIRSVNAGMIFNNVLGRLMKCWKLLMMIMMMMMKTIRHSNSKLSSDSQPSIGG